MVKSGKLGAYGVTDTISDMRDKTDGSGGKLGNEGSAATDAAISAADYFRRNHDGQIHIKLHHWDHCRCLCLIH